jgi:hypothetical protein
MLEYRDSWVFLLLQEVKHTGGLATHKDNGSEHGSAGWGSIFIEKTLGERFLVGIDYVPGSLEQKLLRLQNRI